MLTNEQIAEIEASLKWTENALNSPDPVVDQALALVGELRAERTRTETLRAALKDLLELTIPHGSPHVSLCSTNCCVYCAASRALAASVEEPA